ncbi:uncharacterized protein involved in response to NO [Bradyrhizobium sp. USDA 4454]
MRTTTAVLCLAVLWTGAALAAPADDRERQQAAVALEAAMILPSASETLRGIVDRVDERNDTLLIRLSADKTEAFKVQDGLIFNAVRFGDPVEISVQTIAGFRTIVGLSKE